MFFFLFCINVSLWLFIKCFYTVVIILSKKKVDGQIIDFVTMSQQRCTILYFIKCNTYSLYDVYVWVCEYNKSLYFVNKTYGRIGVSRDSENFKKAIHFSICTMWGRIKKNRVYTRFLLGLLSFLVKGS